MKTLKNSFKQKLFKNESGTVIILVALGMTAFMGFVALVVDGGQLYWEKSRLQKAVDAAVLAGVQELPKFPDKAQAAAISTVRANNVGFEALTITFNPTYTSIKVEAKKGVQHTFASAFGFSKSDIKAKAASQIMTLTSGMGAIPLGVDKNQPLIYGQKVKLKLGSDPAVGNFGALDYTGGGGGGSEFRDALDYGFDGELKVGQIISTERGNKVGPTVQGIATRINADPYSSYYDYTNDSPRIVLVPVYTVLDKFSVKIEGFATFFLEKANSEGDLGEVTGRFIEITHSGAITSGQSGYGTYGYKLTE